MHDALDSLLSAIGSIFEAIGNLCYALLNWQSFDKPRRVFTRGFVAFCALVAVLELWFLNATFGQGA
ncbi:hypothetical protein N5F23_15690 [Pseudomonas sichuanensis]|uniref:hypothetical protein n=1 Tax=Pseudomonas TaxID=286 RepID=UPI00129B9BCD|nr:MULTISPECIES: hypothetical protein [Pseudomonas]MDH0731452.1 hypothetical protein [Pseudomonas sichuanensis]MDH1584020.1 hypothetical protein [Pseudomonas sichuanensis]MDH1591889.1 hypothetical protein [Pseudomonas sichuanensis]MDH1597337.1 hypothetical protein [Pseudomonas sichuanensis]